MFPALLPMFFARSARRAAVCSPIDWEIAGEPELGAHLVTPRSGYEHHGIYVGQGRVIHYAGFCTSLRRGAVEESTLSQFAAGRVLLVRLHPMALYTGNQAVLRARSRLGENTYRLLTNNCEHLAVWVLDGRKHSHQVRSCLRHPGQAMRTVTGIVKSLIAARRQVAARAA